jgi:gliding motility-associated-like protein
MRSLLSFIFSILIKITYATHIVGGGFDVQWISGNTYQITLVVYRDCTSETDFNKTVYIGIYDRVTHQRKDSIGITQGPVSKINPSFAQCVTAVPGCTEKAIYTRQITLSPTKYNNFSGYYISWERCCRNAIIKNIQSPGDASMAFYAEIPSPARFINSTPKLIVNPFTVLCVDNLFNYDITYTDADGDSLSYELITPLNGTLDRNRPNDDQFNNRPILNPGPYIPITWLPGFSPQEEIKGNPPLTINNVNGQITIKPSEAGVFVVGIKVKEFRNGIEIGSVNLELQFTVVNCLSNSFPTVKLYQNGNQLNTDTLYVTIPDQIKFGVEVYDADSIDTVYVTNNMDSLDYSNIGLTTNKTFNKVTYNWTWNTNCKLSNKPFHKYTVTVKDKGCPIPKTTQRVFYIKVTPMPVHPSTDVLCIELQNNQSCKVYFGDSARYKPYFKCYNIYRADGNVNFKLIDSIFDRNANFYNDFNTPNYSTINYRYLIRVENECGFEGSISDTLGTFDQLKMLPDKQYLYNVTVKDDEVHLTWNQTKELDFARYFLWKGYRNQKPEEFVMELDFLKKTDTLYLDKKVQVNDTSHCYYVVMLDTCGNYGPAGKIFCTTVLRGSSKYFENTLYWQKFMFGDDYPVKYDLYKYAPNSIVRIPVGLYNDTTLNIKDIDFNTDDGRYTYELDVLHQPVGWPGTIARSTSNKVSLEQKPYVFVPNAFTPNDDGVNDTWQIRDVFVKDYVLKVYDRWGKLVFETFDKNQQWNGKMFDGSSAPNDAYIYILTYTGWLDEVGIEKGNVTIIR